VLALVVVKALMGSPWGTFAVFCTIPIAIFMGVYARFIRVGRNRRDGRRSGVVLLLASLIYGKTVSEDPQLAALFDYRGETLALIIIGLWVRCLGVCRFGCCSPRAITCRPSSRSARWRSLAIGILFVQPDLKMPSVTRFIERHRSGCGPAACSPSCSSRSPAERVSGLPLADIVGHDAKDARERETRCG